MSNFFKAVAPDFFPEPSGGGGGAPFDDEFVIDWTQETPQVIAHGATYIDSQVGMPTVISLAGAGANGSAEIIAGGLEIVANGGAGASHALWDLGLCAAAAPTPRTVDWRRSQLEVALVFSELDFTGLVSNFDWWQIGYGFINHGSPGDGSVRYGWGGNTVRNNFRGTIDGPNTGAQTYNQGITEPASAISVTRVNPNGFHIGYRTSSSPELTQLTDMTQAVAGGYAVSDEFGWPKYNQGAEAQAMHTRARVTSVSGTVRLVISKTIIRLLGVS